MKITFSFLISILLLAHGATRAQDTIRKYYPSGKLYTLQTDTVLIAYEEDGSLHSRIPLKNHKRNGLSYLYLDGRLYLTIPYKDDMMEGWMIGYDSTGQVNQRALFRANIELPRYTHYTGRCPGRIDYRDSAGHVVYSETDKQKIWTTVGHPKGCH